MASAAWAEQQAALPRITAWASRKSGEEDR